MNGDRKGKLGSCPGGLVLLLFVRSRVQYFSDFDATSSLPFF
jgi:hypothetical protein